MSATPPMALVANVRMPSERANSLQVARAGSAFAAHGHDTTVLYAVRHEPRGTVKRDPWEVYAIPRDARPALRAVTCVDWVDRVPRRFQFLPARVQELTFARRAARACEREHADAWVLSRELEVGRFLREGAVRGLFLEIHRVPGGRTRRAWLLEAARRSLGIVAISGGVAEDLAALGVARDKLLVEHDGFDAASYADLPGREAARAELGLDPAAPLVVYTGGLLAWKGVDVLVEAARELPGTRFVIAGGMPPDVARIRALAAGLENVRVDGFQPPDRVPLYLAAGDVGVVPNRSTPRISSHYTSPLKVFEAMAAGLPLVASDLPSLRELLTDEHAELVPADDPAALARGLRDLLQDEGRRASMAEALRRRASGHSWAARARRILDWMRQREEPARGA